MPSSNKTSHMGLNVWSGEDVPKRADFNADNQLIDALFAEHVNDSGAHGAPVVGSYTGDGAANREITLSFRPAFLAILPANRPASLHDGVSQVLRLYQGAAAADANGLGISVTANGFALSGETAAGNTSLQAALNESGAVYLYIAYR